MALFVEERRGEQRFFSPACAQTGPMLSFVAEFSKSSVHWVNCDHEAKSDREIQAQPSSISNGTGNAARWATRFHFDQINSKWVPIGKT